MIKVTLEIDNKMAHGCSPVEYMERFILHGAKKTAVKPGSVASFDTPFAKIELTQIEQD